MITKRHAVEVYGTQAALARRLDIGRAAVNKWAWDEPIPELYELRLRFVLDPEHFSSPRGVWTEAK